MAGSGGEEVSGESHEMMMGSSGGEGNHKSY